MRMPSIFSYLLSLFLPPRCHVCGHPLPGTRDYICAGCFADLTKVSYSPSNNPMTEALAVIPGSLDGMAFLRYAASNSCSQLIQDFKYRGFSRLARILGREAVTQLSVTGFFSGVDLILPIPLHRRKLRKRGYNQAREIALGLSDVTGIPVGKQLMAIKHHSTQTRLSRSARMGNVEGVFGLRNPEELEGRTVLLVDDVFTTGATLLSASQTVVSSARSVRIKIFALASAYNG